MLDSGPLAPCYGNVMSSTKPEVLKVSHRRQRRTEPWPHTYNMHRNLVKIVHIIFNLCEQTDIKQAYVLIAINCTPPGYKLKMELNRKPN